MDRKRKFQVETSLYNDFILQLEKDVSDELISAFEEATRKLEKRKRSYREICGQVRKQGWIKGTKLVTRGQELHPMGEHEFETT